MSNVLKLSDACELSASNADLIKWQGELRAACINSILPEDMQDIVTKQVAKAKEGDPKAIQFVMNIIGGNQKITVNNNIIADTESAARLGREMRRG